MLLADGDVGSAVADYIMSTYPDDIALLVTISMNSIYERAKKKGYKVEIFSSEEDILKYAPSGLDLGVLAWWPRIIHHPLIDLPTHGFVNTHPSLLPYNRGKHYNFWAIVEGAPFGVTIHKVDKGIDTGAVIAQLPIKYDWTDTGATLYYKASKAILELFRKIYPDLRLNNIKEKAQLECAGSFHYSTEIDMVSKISLDQSYRAADFLNLIRARTFEGHPACWFEDQGVRYEVTIKIERK